jgi:Cd2+/Zn2+-exporting ATPase
MARCTLEVRGLDCAVEADTLRAALGGAPGVRDLAFDLVGGTVTIDYDPDATDPAALRARIADRAGMQARVRHEPGACEEENSCCASPAQPGRAARLRRWAPVIGSGLAVAAGHVAGWLGGSSAPWPWIARAAFGLAVALAAVELLPRAARSLRRLRLDIYVLMTLAVAGALALGQWDEAAAVAFLFGLSEMLEAVTLERARRAVRALLEIAPETADLIEPDGATRTVPAASVGVGAHVLVRAGARIPVDGRVARGRSSVDQKAITGESVPVLREPGDEVFASTVNGEGFLEVEATRSLGDAVVSRIVERVRAAQRGRTPVEQTVDRFAAVYTPLVVALAVAVMVMPPLLSGADPRWWFQQGLVVLVIACPCALVIATPVAVVSALAAAARRGILIKSGQFLEAFARLRVLAFDKTGTLTRGEPDVVEVVPVAGAMGDELVRIAAALGDRGGHVLGRAIARHARAQALEVPRADDYRAVPGLGASAQVDSTHYHMGSHRFIDEAGLCAPEFHDSLGAAERDAGTPVAVASGAAPLGWLRLADRPRAEAAGVLAALRGLGVEPVMLTGDNPATAAAVARELEIDDRRAGLLPEQKAAAVAELDAARGPAGMVGDGVNDAPALAAARVSVALGGISSGAALETADVVLMADDLNGLPWLVRHSRRALAIIRANIALAVGAKLVFLALAIAGRATLWMAIAADLGVSLLVVANAMRLLRERR